MANRSEYSIKLIKFSDGERYPLLVDSKGIPHWYVALFATTQVRNASKASNTVAAVLSAIKVLLNWAYLYDIESRFIHGNFLTEQELESLRSYIQTKMINNFQPKNSKIVALTKNTEEARSAIQINTNRVNSSIGELLIRKHRKLYNQIRINHYLKTLRVF